MSSTHQAAILTTQGGRVTLQSLGTPKLGPRELLISVDAIALNPIDCYMRDFGIFLTTYPAVLGSDIAGTVEATGSDIPSSSPYKPNTRVAGFATAFFRGGEPPFGAFQKKVILPVENACVIPDKLSFTDAATVPMGVLTAWSGFTTIGLPTSNSSLFNPGDKAGLLVWGASSAVGMATIQVAKTLGFTSIYATSSPKHHSQLMSLGATHAFDYNSPSAVQDIIAAARSDSVTLKHGYRANGDIQPCLEILAAFSSSSEKAKLASAPMIDASTPTHENVETKFVMLPQGEAAAEHFEFVYKEWLAPRLEKGEYVPAPKARVMPGGLEGVDAGLDTLKGGVSGEKLVVEI